MANSIAYSTVITLTPDGSSTVSDRVSVSRSIDVTESSKGEVKVASEATQSIPFGGVATAKIVFIETSGAATMNINGGAENIPIEGAMTLEGPITSIDVVDTSVAENTVSWFVGG